MVINGRINPESLRALKASLKAKPVLLAHNMRKALQNMGDEHSGRILERFRGGTPLHSRTGALKKIHTKVIGRSLKDLKLKNFSLVKYAPAQEHGATITPKPPNQWLAYPIADNLTAAGVPRNVSARNYMERNPDAFVLFLKKDNRRVGYIVIQNGRDLSFMFRLARRSVIPPRLGFFATWKSMDGFRTRQYAKALRNTTIGRRTA